MYLNGRKSSCHHATITSTHHCCMHFYLFLHAFIPDFIAFCLFCSFSFHLVNSLLDYALMIHYGLPSTQLPQFLHLPLHPFLSSNVREDSFYNYCILELSMFLFHLMYLTWSPFLIFLFLVSVFFFLQ